MPFRVSGLSDGYRPLVSPSAGPVPMLAFTWASAATRAGDTFTLRLTAFLTPINALAPRSAIWGDGC